MEVFRESKDGVREGERVGVASFASKQKLVTDSRHLHNKRKTRLLVGFFFYMFRLGASQLLGLRRESKSFSVFFKFTNFKK
jgi:hypothetical protein